MLHELTLPGPVVTLEPLARTHAAAWAALGDVDAYAFHTSPPPLDRDAAEANIALFQGNPVTTAFAVVDTSSGELRGVTSFYEHAPVVPRIEIGNTFYGRRFWGGDTNPHVKLLMLGHAFDSWRCERVALRCDAANIRSAEAIGRLGAKPEGVLRAHRRRHDGTVADTAYFSIVRDQWPEVRRGLMSRVEPDQ
jgi:RimJ/RimL family protein N-acetyltransferase